MVLRHPTTNVVYLEKNCVLWYNLLVGFYIVLYFIGILKCGLKNIVGAQQTCHFLWGPLFCCNPSQQALPAKADKFFVHKGTNLQK